ncbi:FUSC family protein [Acetobacterium bakii]|uniref:FUSC family protein n=1 Tax=Acetobacterium bakii TaxID=52689 RepID=UPI0006811167|nr:aromatic acid exporter family protein [Acetobacterium bakii]
MKLCHLPPIGMRNIKTALSVFICVVVFAIMGPQFNPMFAAVAALVCMGNSIENSVEAGWNRILGTIIGGAAGVFGIFICNLVNLEFTYIAIIPIGTVGLIYLCNNLKKAGAIIICCVVFISLMTTYPQETGSYALSFLRLLETGFGVIVAVLVNRFIKVPECNENSEKTEEIMEKELTEEKTHKKMKVSSVIYMILKP